MKTCCFLVILTFSQMSFAIQQQPISVKERLRLSLWYEGIGKKKMKKQMVRHQPHLPEELARPLSRI